LGRELGQGIGQRIGQSYEISAVALARSCLQATATRRRVMSMPRRVPTSRQCTDQEAREQTTMSSTTKK